jgi:choline kinase
VKAIILSAGQGTRLFPHTVVRPKCLVPVDGQRSILEIQLETLAECGIEEAVVVVGHGAELVESFLQKNTVPGIRTRTLFNPFYLASDNLMSCWLAMEEMTSDFIILNGDTIFEHGVLDTLINSPQAPITLAVNRKEEYDADDMKVTLGSGGRLTAVSKGIKGVVDGESIGVMCFRGEGPMVFRAALERAAREPEALKSYYLKIIDNVSHFINVQTADITGLWWAEVDTPTDLNEVREALSFEGQTHEAQVANWTEQSPLQVVR